MLIRRLTFASASLISLGIVTATAAMHCWAGRALICKCGYVKPWWWGEGAVVAIRDNLLLNIINVIDPIAWITKWQEGG